MKPGFKSVEPSNPFLVHAKSVHQDLKTGLRSFVVGLYDFGLGFAVLGLGFVAGANTQKA